jgi:hypothetical protein
VEFEAEVDRVSKSAVHGMNVEKAFQGLNAEFAEIAEKKLCVLCDLSVAQCK